MSDADESQLGPVTRVTRALISAIPDRDVSAALAQLSSANADFSPYDKSVAANIASQSEITRDGLQKVVLNSYLPRIMVRTDKPMYDRLMSMTSELEAFPRIIQIVPRVQIALEMIAVSPMFDLFSSTVEPLLEESTPEEIAAATPLQVETGDVTVDLVDVTQKFVSSLSTCSPLKVAQEYD